jgi:hypothetical protein
MTGGYSGCSVKNAVFTTLIVLFECPLWKPANLYIFTVKLVRMDEVDVTYNIFFRYFDQEQCHFTTFLLLVKELRRESTFLLSGGFYGFGVLTS